MKKPHQITINQKLDNEIQKELFHK